MGILWCSGQTTHLSPLRLRIPILSVLKLWLQLILAKYDINGNYSTYIKATSTKLAIMIVRPSVNKLSCYGNGHVTIASLILCYLSLRTWEMGLGIMLALQIVCFRKHVYSSLSV